MLFSFAFALYFLALYVYGIKIKKNKNLSNNQVGSKFAWLCVWRRGHY